mmetsp:Transcript_27717/g.54585  ORF Transcript_27717/g.54585 Transcript_27717/m.54585 type:complete len:206 (-) Transcript_27717:305-922(-)
MADQIEQMQSLLDEWTRIFESESIDDVNMIQSIDQTHIEMLQLCKDKDKAMKTLIKDLTQKTSTIKAATQENREAALVARKEELEQLKANALAELKKMRETLTSSNTDLKELEEKCFALNKEKTDAEADLVNQLAPLRKTLQMMTNISHITWDYNAENQLKGAFHLVNKKRVKPFSVKVTPGHKVSAVNSMWDMLWEDQQAVMVA